MFHQILQLQSGKNKFMSQVSQSHCGNWNILNYIQLHLGKAIAILPGVSVYYFHIEFMNPGTVYMYLYHQEVPQILLFFVMVSKTTMVAKQGISNRYLQMNFRRISLCDSHKGHNFLLVTYRKRFSDYNLGIPARHHLAIYNSFKSSRTRTPMLVSVFTYIVQSLTVQNQKEAEL